MKKLLAFTSLLLLFAVGAQIAGARIYNVPSSTFSLTPWTSTINGGGYSLTNAGQITGTYFTATSTTATSTFAAGITIGTGYSPYPEYSFNADTNTGIDSTAPDVMNFVNAGSNTITLTSTNKVGVGVSSPAWSLQVNKAGAPQFGLSDPNAATNLKNWAFTSQGGSLYIDKTTDAYATSTTPNVVLGNNGTASFAGSARGGTLVNTDGATITVDWSKGNTQEVVLGATGRTLAFSNVTPGTALKLWVWQDGTGSRTITTYPTGVRWAGGTAPTLTTTANKFDMLVFTTASSTTAFTGGASVNY